LHTGRKDFFTLVLDEKMGSLKKQKSRTSSYKKRCMNQSTREKNSDRVDPRKEGLQVCARRAGLSLPGLTFSKKQEEAESAAACTKSQFPCTHERTISPKTAGIGVGRPTLNFEKFTSAFVHHVFEYFFTCVSPPIHRRNLVKLDSTKM
jgi:hypothetical protein